MLLSGNTSFCLTIECPRSVHAIVLALSLEVSDFHILIKKRITFMDRVKRVIHCDRAYKMGLNGKNITVAVMDTGIAHIWTLTREFYILRISARRNLRRMMIMGMEHMSQESLAAVD